jgi:hypothetical protein
MTVLRCAAQMVLKDNRYEWAYDQPHVNWTFNEGPVPLNLTGKMARSRDLNELPITEVGPVGPYDPSPEANNLYYFYLSPTEPKHRFALALEAGNISEVDELWRYQTVAIRSNYGMTLRIFDNPRYTKQLWRCGGDRRRRSQPGAAAVDRCCPAWPGSSACSLDRNPRASRLGGLQVTPPSNTGITRSPPLPGRGGGGAKLEARGGAARGGTVSNAPRPWCDAASCRDSVVARAAAGGACGRRRRTAAPWTSWSL